jgi:ribonuclease P protein component
VGVINSPSATRHSLIPDPSLSEPQASEHQGSEHQDSKNQDCENQTKKSFPKSVRILRSSDFRTIYDTGKRYSCAHFAAFYLRVEEFENARIGFTTPRALGRANVRNRVKRRFREAVRRHLAELSPKWSVVINPRRSSLEIAFPALEKEIVKLFGHLSKIGRHGS